MPSHRGDRNGWSWTAGEDAALKAMAACGHTAHDAAAHLERSVADVATRCGEQLASADADAVAAGIGSICADHGLCFEPGSEEQLALLDLALCGVPIKEAMLWCSGHPERASAETIESLRCVPSFAASLEYVTRMGLWASWAGDEEFEAVAMLMKRPSGAVREMVDAMLSAFEPPRPADVLRRLGRPLPLPAPAAAFICAPADRLEAIALRMASLQCPAGSWQAPAGCAKGAKAGSRWASRGRGGKRHKRSGRRAPSPSYPVGAPTRLSERPCASAHKDTRTAAQKAWEKLTSW